MITAGVGGPKCMIATGVGGPKCMITAGVSGPKCMITAEGGANATRPRSRGPGPRDAGGRYWDRTSDPLGVNEVLSR